MSRKKRLWLCLPPIALCLIDGLLTLAGQSAGYWSGDYQAANEFNPIFRPFLQWHPVAFIAGGAISMIGFILAILYFPLMPALVISFGFSLGKLPRRVTRRRNTSVCS